MRCLRLLNLAGAGVDAEWDDEVIVYSAGCVFSKNKRKKNRARRRGFIKLGIINYFRPLIARFEAFSGLTLVFAVASSILAWVAKLQSPSFHLASGKT